jgi:hypothetical protein
MKKIFYLVAATIPWLLACNSNDRTPTTDTSDTDINAARSFIKAALLGDFEKAKDFMVKDSLSIGQLNAIERLNERLTPQEKEKYRTASIRIYDDRKINDSTSVIKYSNSYRNKVDSLKVIKANGKWLVDFKFMLSKNDSLP